MEKNLLSPGKSLFLVILLFILSLFGVTEYPGTIQNYFLFDISWLLLLFVTFTYTNVYGLFCANIMLFLGFWVKFMFNLVLGYDFIEPVGYWPQVAEKNLALYWDKVLFISSIAVLGLLLANIIVFFYKKTCDSDNLRSPYVPEWYSKHSDLAWITVFIVSLIASIINYWGHINFTGLRPRIILPLHGNAIITWIIVFVSPLCMATFIGWDKNLKKGCQRIYYLITLAVIVSISTLSRYVYIFWSAPFFLLLMKDLSFKKLIQIKKKHSKLIFLSILFFLLSLILVSLFRGHYYNIEKNSVKSITVKENYSSNLQQIYYQLREINQLFLVRWVGIEGVMATAAYPYSGMTFFKTGMFEKPSPYETGIYTKKVLEKNFSSNAKHMFSSIPGLIGILNYSSSIGVIFGGVLLIGLLLGLIELISRRLINNDLLLSQQGIFIAYWCVSGLNIPYLGVIHLLECFMVILLLYYLDFTYKRLKNLRRFNVISFLKI